MKGIKAKGGEATAVAASISDKAQLENLVAEARKAYGRIDIMVCNAASNPYFGPLTGLKDEVFQKIMQNNVMSNLWLMNMVGPEMAERKDGVFIIVSSIGALVGSAHIAAYNMSKAADLSLVKSLAMEWGKHNIRVNAHRARPDPDRLRQGAVGQSADPQGAGEQGGAEAHRPARRYRRRRGVPGLEGRQLRLRPDASSPTAA